MTCRWCKGTRLIQGCFFESWECLECKEPEKETKTAQPSGGIPSYIRATLQYLGQGQIVSDPLTLEDWVSDAAGEAWSRAYKIGRWENRGKL